MERSYFLANFMSFFFLNRFWFVHKPFVRMTKLLSLAYFPLVYCLHPAFLFCQFAALTYYMIKCFIFFEVHTLFFYFLSTFLLFTHLVFMALVFGAISKSPQVQLPQFVAWSIHTVVFLPLFVFEILSFLLCLFVL